MDPSAVYVRATDKDSPLAPVLQEYKEYMHNAVKQPVVSANMLYSLYYGIL